MSHPATCESDTKIDNKEHLMRDPPRSQLELMAPYRKADKEMISDLPACDDQCHRVRSGSYSAKTWNWTSFSTSRFLFNGTVGETRGPDPEEGRESIRVELRFL